MPSQVPQPTLLSTFKSVGESWCLMLSGSIVVQCNTNLWNYFLWKRWKLSCKFSKMVVQKYLRHHVSSTLWYVTLSAFWKLVLPPMLWECFQRWRIICYAVTSLVPHWDIKNLVNSWGNLLRSVPHIYFGLKIKSYQYLGHYRRFRFLHGSYWQGNIRPLLFEPKFHFLPLRNFLGHTVTNRFLQIVIVVWLITTS